MDAPDGADPVPPQGFPTTAWSLVLSLASTEDLRRASIGRLFTQYHRAILAHLRRTWRKKSFEEIEDLAGAFFEWLLQRDVFQSLDRTKARFRTFLKTVLDRFARDRHDSDTAVKRGGGVRRVPFSGKAADIEDVAAAHDALSPEQMLDEVIRQDFLSRAKDRVRAWAESTGRAVQFEAFRLYALEPDEDATYLSVAQRLGIKESDVRNHIHGMRRRLEHELKDLIRPTVQDPDRDTEEEFLELYGGR
jgi:RNA polymerase sigma factor (sigma-70 family)